MGWVASTLHTTSEHGVSSTTTADAHTSATSSRLNWRPRRFKLTRPFRRKTDYGFWACAITFQLASTSPSYWLDRSRFEFCWGKKILYSPIPSKSALGPNQPPVQWVPGWFPEGKSARTEIEHLSLSSAQIWWPCTCSPSLRFPGMHRDDSTFFVWNQLAQDGSNGYLVPTRYWTLLIKQNRCTNFSNLFLE